MTDHEHSYIYIGDINDHLICPICRQPFIEPAQTQCGHTFCHSCITLALQSSSLCPIDRLPLSSDDITPAPKIVASLVNELMVRCPLECGVDVERGCLKGHLKGSCELETITCVCGKSITRREQQSVLDLEQADGRDVNENTIGCIHEWQLCGHCSTQIQRLNRKTHLQACPAQQSQCQYCSTCFPNTSIEAHNQTCPSFPLPCPHTQLGCPSTSLPRSTLPTHLNECPFAPLSPLLTTLLSRVSRLETQPPPPPDPEIDRLRVDLDILNQALGDLEIRFSNAVVSERIRMGEEVDRLRGQVGALRREVWFTRRRDIGGMELASTSTPSGATAGLTETATAAGPSITPELVPTKRLNDTTMKQIGKL